ncbi:MAG: RluA family pseudouridine synthase [Mycoplasmataceae bacterium]|jgi:23S rRNA pseudouridine1911/1915/1917 synthase|nr:RluA family pseudouridine synthase [Mycoplasmataceae bacterium]
MKKIIVQHLNVKERLDVYLTKTLNQKRSFIDKLFKKQLILVNNELPIKKGMLVENSFVITINDLPNLTNKLEHHHIDLKIVYEDEELIVIDKPKHLLVHPTTFGEQNTLINALLNRIQLEDFDDLLRPGIVHRLDRDTTGLIVIAKNQTSYDALLKQIENKILVRKYLALVHHNFQDEYLLIKAPIIRSQQNLLKMVVSDEAKAKAAETEITILENYHHGALIECKLLTGRTHQIRVHLAYIHHPVFNDELYGNYDGYKDYGQFLHAHYLSFMHPINKAILHFESQPDKIFDSLKHKLRTER